MGRRKRRRFRKSPCWDLVLVLVLRLDDVRKRWGDAVLRSKGDAGEGESSICYRVADGKRDGNILVTAFVTFREMGDPPGELNAIQVRYAKKTDRKSYANCTPISAESLRASGELPLLGLTRQALEKQIGLKALTTHGDDLGYAQCSKKPMLQSDPQYDFWKGRPHCFAKDEEPYFDDCSQWDVDLQNQRVIGFRVNRVRSIC